MATIIRRRNQLLKAEVDILCYWVEERESIRLQREMNLPWPWTKDFLLGNFRWCNARRMDDRVSKWLLGWHRQHPEFNVQDRVVAAVAGRLINWPPSLQEVPYPVPYLEPKWTKALVRRKNRGEKVFTGAYIVNGALGGDKILQVTQKILAPLWKIRGEVSRHPRRIGEIASWLNGKPGIGSFMAGQAAADLRHIHHEIPWEDTMTWAPQGPGSKRGANRLVGNPLSTAMPLHEWLTVVQRAHAALAARLPITAKRLELMDVQNCLCEYDKYRRLTLKEGSVRSKYVHGRSDTCGF